MPCVEVANEKFLSLLLTMNRGVMASAFVPPEYIANLCMAVQMTRQHKQVI